MRSLDELIDANKPGRELVEERQSELLGLRVTTHSSMGALVYGCGGIVDRGRLAARARLRT